MKLIEYLENVYSIAIWSVSRFPSCNGNETKKKKLYVYIRMSGGESSKMECLLTETKHRE